MIIPTLINREDALIAYLDMYYTEQIVVVVDIAQTNDIGFLRQILRSLDIVPSSADISAVNFYEYLIFQFEADATEMFPDMAEFNETEAFHAALPKEKMTSFVWYGGGFDDEARDEFLDSIEHHISAEAVEEAFELVE